MVYKLYKYDYFVSDKGKVCRLRNGKKEKVKMLKGKHYLYFHIFQNNENVFIHKAVASYVNHSENMLNRSSWKKDKKKGEAR